jgi:phenylacetate-coenzyme A ligase PaaK-like adenylate-forming protein
MNTFDHPKWGQLSADKARSLQNSTLHTFIRDQVYANCPYYRKKFMEIGIEPGDIRTTEDLVKLPFTSKADLAEAVTDGRIRDFLILPDTEKLRRRPSTILRALLTGPKRTRMALDQEYRPILLTSTTGRSAEPVPFLYTRKDINHLAVMGGRIMQAGNCTNEDRLLNVFPYAPHLAYWLTYHAADQAGAFHLGTGGGKTMGTDGNLRLLVKSKPTVMVGMPTFVYHLLRRALEVGEKVEGLKVIALGGEKAPPGLRRKLAGLAEELGSPNLRILSTYGFTEAKGAWTECAVSPEEPSTGYHLSPEFGLIEIVDPKTGEPLPPETPGEIVYTPVDARGSIVLRYRTGDLSEGGLTWAPCPACGRTLPRLLGRISRVSEQRRMKLDKLKGALVDFNELEVILDDVDGIGSWQLELRKANNDPLEVDELHLRLSLEPNQKPEEIENIVRRRFRDVTEVTPNDITYHDPDEMRLFHGVGKNLKEEKIVDRRSLAETPHPASPKPRPPARRRKKTKEAV